MQIWNLPTNEKYVTFSRENDILPQKKVPGSSHEAKL